MGSILNSSALGVSIDLLERVEIISGPPSSLYGSNAILGTINVITRDGKDFNGGIVSAGVNTNTKNYVNFVTGKKFDSGIDIIASYNFAFSRGYDLYFEEYDETHPVYGNPFHPDYNPLAHNQGIAHRKNNSQAHTAYLGATYNNYKLTSFYSSS
jgi:outer membrane cobalamin receptor